MKVNPQVPQTSLVDERYSIGQKSSAGASNLPNQDYAHVGVIDCRAGHLIVAAVADGMGGANGALAAQNAVEKAFASISDSQLEKIPDVIEEAVQSANKAVFEFNKQSGAPAFSTLALAVICSSRLYVGNVGDSRVYWLQESGKLIQLTQDHTYANLLGAEANPGEADKLAHVIGRKASIGVDLGFYLEGVSHDRKQAFRLGEAGLPVKDGDSVLVCTDGLTQSDPSGTRYATDGELVESMQSEFAPASAVRMVGFAEGRKVKDNVTAVVIQRLTDQRISQMEHRLQAAKKSTRIRKMVLSGISLTLFAAIVFLISGILHSRVQLAEAQAAALEVKQVTGTPIPTATATQAISPGEARVEEAFGAERASYRNPDGTGGVLMPGMYLADGSSIGSADGSVKILASNQTGNICLSYLLPTSDARVILANGFVFELIRGGIYVNPDGGRVEIRLPNFNNAVARVEGSRMAVQIISEKEAAVLCFEGDCDFRGSAEQDWEIIPTGEKRVFNFYTGEMSYSEIIPYEEQVLINNGCELCIVDLMPTLTPTSVIIPTGTPEPTMTNVPYKPRKTPTPTTKPTKPPKNWH